MRLLYSSSEFYIKQVKHSQSTSATPLLPWIIAEQDGTVQAAHCTCMAGYVNQPLANYLLPHVHS